MAISHMIYRSTYQLVLLILLSALQLAHMTSAPQFIQSPSNQTGVEGGVASFVCQTRGDPQPKISWTKNGKSLSLRLQMIEFAEASGSVLRIQPLRKSHDEAVYECVGSNEIGEIRSSARLSVLQVDQLPAGFPSIDMGPQLKVVQRSRTATMLCAASGSPDPEITWFKDFLPIDTNGNRQIKLLRSGALQIENSDVADQGRYEYVATNSEGTCYSAPASFYVREPNEVRRVPPRFSIPPSDHEILLGESVNLTCVAVGAPMPYVKWMQGDEELTSEDEMPVGRNVLELINVRQSANYTCVAISSLGMIAADAQITIKVPSQPRELKADVKSETSVLLSWIPPAHSGTDSITGYELIYRRAEQSEQKISFDPGSSYLLDNLDPFSSYAFKLAARNKHGLGSFTKEITVSLKSQTPQAQKFCVKL